MNYSEVYEEVGQSSEVLGASPWRLIKILLEHLDEKVARALHALQEQDIPQKCASISKANDIVVYLKDILEPGADMELYTRVHGIYTHLEQLLFEANAQNNVLALEQAQKIIANLCVWWDKVDG